MLYHGGAVGKCLPLIAIELVHVLDKVLKYILF